jgi:hypothetical protein
MMRHDLPGLFEGLSAEQARELSRQILPALFQLREQITRGWPMDQEKRPVRSPQAGEELAKVNDVKVPG